jgi:HSP20 family protein
MTALMRVTPNTLFNEFERMFDREVAQPRVRHNLTVALDVTEDEDVYAVIASVPGINPDDIEITMEDNVLTIEGEITSNDEEETAKYHLRERRYGSFKRSIRFPLTVDADAIDANYDRGLLTLTVPKAEIVKPRRIEISVK